jgi:cytochrome P450
MTAPASPPLPDGSPAQAIPGPRPRPLVGNALDIDRKHAVEGAIKLAREHGPVYRLVVPGADPRYVVSGADLVEEVCDERRFRRTPRWSRSTGNCSARTQSAPRGTSRSRCPPG